jgi:hypothetical protein
VRYDATRYDGPSLTAVIAISHSGKRRVICFPCVERAVVLGRRKWYRVFVSGSGPRGGGQEERVYGSTSDGGRVVGRARCGLRRGRDLFFRWHLDRVSGDHTRCTRLLPRLNEPGSGEPDPRHRRGSPQRYLNSDQRPRSSTAVVHGGQVKPKGTLPELAGIGLSYHSISPGFG